MRTARFVVGAAAAMGVAVGCGGGGYNNTAAPSTMPGAPAGPTVMIMTAGPDPRMLPVEVGQRVAFMNHTSRNIQIASDPHPTHGICPPINQAGMLAPGQTGMTAALTQPGTCTFHDHLNPDDASSRGTILVGVADPGPGPTYQTQ